MTVGGVVLAVFHHGEAVTSHGDDEDAEIDHHGAEHAAIKGFVGEVFVHGERPYEGEDTHAEGLDGGNVDSSAEDVAPAAV